MVLNKQKKISPLYRVRRNVGSFEEECTMQLCWKLIDKNVSFVIISAESTDQSPKAAIAEMREEVRKLGFGSNEFIARWRDDGETQSEERHILIKGFTLKQAIRFGKKHERSSIMYKDKDGLREICITDSETHKSGDVIRAIDIDPGKPLDAATASEIFIGRKLSKDSFELRDRRLINTWHGFEEIKLQIQK